jgi:hypothetical protein
VGRERPSYPAGDEIPQERVEAALSARVRSATRSSLLSQSRRSASEAASGSTAASLSLREAASAVARASSPSLLRALPAKLAPAPVPKAWAPRPLPIGLSPPTSPPGAYPEAACVLHRLERRSGYLLAQRSRALRPTRSCGKLACSRSSPKTSSMAATATVTPCGDRPL